MAKSRFSQEWLKTMNDRARKCKYEIGNPEVVSSFYAVKKTPGGPWRISNGRAWWSEPVLVREIHEYRDGVVTAHNYIEGVTMFSRRHITDANLYPARASELTNMLPLSKVVFFDHTQLDERGRATRYVFTFKTPFMMKGVDITEEWKETEDDDDEGI